LSSTCLASLWPFSRSDGILILLRNQYNLHTGKCSLALLAAPDSPDDQPTLPELRAFFLAVLILLLALPFFSSSG